MTKQSTFLNSAAESPLNTRVRQRLGEYLDLVSETPQQKPSVRGAVREQLAALLGGQPTEYALVTSTGVGIGIVASGLRLQPGDNVVVPEDEHWNNTFPWLALRERGVEVRLVPTEPDNSISPERVAAFTDERTKLVAVAAVRFNSGFRTDLQRISQIAHHVGALFLVDGIQATGVVPLNVDRDGIDILACAGFKWLLGLPGTGFLYVRQSAQALITPALPGMFAAKNNLRELHYWPDARRYETGSIAYSLFYAWTAGLELLREVGVENIYQRVLQLTDRLIAGLSAKQHSIISPVADLKGRSGILLCSVGSADENRRLYERLLAERVIITLRDGVCRISPSFFNTEAEIDRLLNMLD